MNAVKMAGGMTSTQIPRLPGSRTPDPAPMYPNRLIEYIGPQDFYEWKRHGVYVMFTAQDEFCGRKVARIDRTDVFHSMMQYPTMFSVAEDLERRMQARQMAEAIVEYGAEVVQALLQVPEFREAIGSAAKAPPRKRGRKPRVPPNHAPESEENAPEATSITAQSVPEEPET